MEHQTGWGGSGRRTLALAVVGALAALVPGSLAGAATADGAATAVSIIRRRANLTNFGQVNFSGAQATTGGTSTALGSFANPHQIIMVTGSGTPKASPLPAWQNLQTGQETFTDTWSPPEQAKRPMRQVPRPIPTLGKS
jgi:hypothetical protein